MATKKEDDSGEAKKKGKGKLIILVILFLLIAGGAGGGWYWWKYIKNADSAAEEDGAAKKKKKKKETGPVFVSLEAFTVNLQGEEGQLLQTVIALQLFDEEDAARLKQHMPLVRSRLVMLLSSKRAADILTAEGKTALAKEIAEQVKQPLAPGDSPMEVQNVLFTSFIVQ